MAARTAEATERRCRRTACCRSRGVVATRSLNVVPACGSCNASKCNTEVTTWLRRKKLDEQAFLVRQAEVALLVTATP